MNPLRASTKSRTEEPLSWFRPQTTRARSWSGWVSGSPAQTWRDSSSPHSPRSSWVYGGCSTTSELIDKILFLAIVVKIFKSFVKLFKPICRALVSRLLALKIVESDLKMIFLITQNYHVLCHAFQVLSGQVQRRLPKR